MTKHEKEFLKPVKALLDTNCLITHLKTVRVGDIIKLNEVETTGEDDKALLKTGVTLTVEIIHVERVEIDAYTKLYFDKNTAVYSQNEVVGGMIQTSLNKVGPQHRKTVTQEVFNNQTEGGVTFTTSCIKNITLGDEIQIDEASEGTQYENKITGIINEITKREDGTGFNVTVTITTLEKKDNFSNDLKLNFKRHFIKLEQLTQIDLHETGKRATILNSRNLEVKPGDEVFTSYIDYSNKSIEVCIKVTEVKLVDKINNENRVDILGVAQSVKTM